MSTIFLTGRTGAIGSCLAPVLKSAGHKLFCLVRRKTEMEASEAIFGDITLPGLGINEFWKKEWRGKIDMVLHCASSIKFEEMHAEETKRTNIEGTKNVLDFAKDMQIREMRDVSTVFVAGDAKNFGEEDLETGQKLRNWYEKTKFSAERLVKDWNYGQHSIYRLSIVVGNTVTGCVPAFNGYYGFMAMAWHLKQYLASLPMENLRESGIFFMPDGTLNLPIHGNFSETSTLNIVPVDWAVKMLAELVELPSDGRTFHIAHPNPPNTRWLNEVSLKHLGIAGFCYGSPPKHISKSAINRLQRMFNRGTAIYLPYIMHEAKFGVRNLPDVLGGRYHPPPEIDEVFVKRLMDFAKSVNFGRK